MFALPASDIEECQNLRLFMWDFLSSSISARIIFEIRKNADSNGGISPDTYTVTAAEMFEFLKEMAAIKDKFIEKFKNELTPEDISSLKINLSIGKTKLVVKPDATTH